MEHLLFVAYLLLFAWLITKLGFFTRSGLTHSQLVIFFLLKVMAGIFYGWIGAYYGLTAQMVDTWTYHNEGLYEYTQLKSHPGAFFSGIFHTDYESGYINFLTSKDSWWNDLKANMFIKLLALFNLFSFGNYYINVVFYALLSLVGPIAFYRVMADVFPQRRTAALLATFLIPSFLYWTSGLHKDGLIFVGFGLIAYHLYFGQKQGRFGPARLFWILLSFVTVLVLRNFLILALVPGMTAWVLARRWPKKPLLTYGIVYAIALLFFFGGRYLHPRLDFPEAVAVKQKEFRMLGGGSSVPARPVEASLQSFVVNAPQAFTLSTLRPYPGDVKHLLSLAAAVEVAALLLLFLLFLFFRLPADHTDRPFLYFCLFFSFSVLMMIGYSVTILGAIVRYRSIVLPFLLVPLVARIDWQRIGRMLNR